MSDGLYKSVEDALGTEHANREIASMVATEFTQQSTLNGVAQAVVDKVVRLHHDAYMTSIDHRKQLCQKRDDIMLVVRNFNHPLPNAISSPSTGISNPFQTTAMPPLSINIPSPSESPSKSPPPTLGISSAARPSFFISSQSSSEPVATAASTPSTHASTLSSTISTDSDSGICEHSHFNQRSLRTESLKLDENGRVAPYVLFAEFHNALEEIMKHSEMLSTWILNPDLNMRQLRRTW
jgi:TAK1-binding protein 1